MPVQPSQQVWPKHLHFQFCLSISHQLYCLSPDEEIAEDDEFESFYGFTNSDIDIAKSKRLMIENFDNNYTSYSDIQSLRRSGPQSLGHYGQCGDQGENGQFGQHPGLVAKKE